MAERRRVKRRTVKLIGVAGARQGSHDSFCAYYSAATLLSALRPEFHDSFEADNVRADPLFSHVARRQGETLEKLVASWLASGMELSRVTGALNRLCRGEPVTRFRYRTASRSQKTFELLCQKVDEGLPSVVGWDGPEIGNHAVVVVGYDHYVGSRSRWLRVLDPIEMQEQLEWGQLEGLALSPLEVVTVTRHDGRRPDKLTTARDAGQQLLMDRTRLDRFDPAAGSYESIPIGRRKR